MAYKVLVDDNYHYMDESKRYELGEFHSYEEAVAALKRIVDEYLLASHKPGMTAQQLCDGYTGFGEDPFIVAVSPSSNIEPKFSAWDYAKERCEELCGSTSESEKATP